MLRQCQINLFYEIIKLFCSVKNYVYLRFGSCNTFFNDFVKLLLKVIYTCYVYYKTKADEFSVF